MNKCYAVVFTDRWRVDFDPVEVWSTQDQAAARAKHLTDNYENQHKTWGERDYFFIVHELPFNQATSSRANQEEPDSAFRLAKEMLEFYDEQYGTLGPQAVEQVFKEFVVWKTTGKKLI